VKARLANLAARALWFAVLATWHVIVVMEPETVAETESM